jgi:hypothetical protein
MLGRRFVAQVVDMGLEGLRLELPCRVERGQLLSLRYDGPLGCYDHDTVGARVVWTRPRGDGNGSEVGVAYTHPPPYLEHSWVRHLLRVFDLEKVSVEDRRKEVRIPVRVEAAVHTLRDSAAPEGASGARGRGLPARIRDIGPGGALIESAADVALGSAVVIEVAGVEGRPVSCEGHVVRKSRLSRSDHWLVGIRFAGPSIELHAQVRASGARPAREA